jgi:hypothetical protein
VEEEEGEDIDVDLDVYGATIYSLIFDMMELISGVDHDKLGLKLNMLRLGFVLCILFGNFAMQGGMLYWIYNFVAAPSVHTVQYVYQKYHAEVFVDDGKYSKEAWEVFEHQDELCGIAFSNFWFMVAILCLWWTTMLNEMRKNERMIRNIASIRHTTNANEIVQVGEDGVQRVKFMTRTVRWMLYIILILPKIVIGLVLLVIGTIWLAATDSFADLILNAIALEFVIAIDELLFEAMLPASIHAKIEETKLWKPAKKLTPAENEKKTLGGYRRSCIYFFGTMGAVYLYMMYGQVIPILGVFPGYALDAECPTYMALTTKRLCEEGKQCFPFGVSAHGHGSTGSGHHHVKAKAHHGHGHHR